MNYDNEKWKPIKGYEGLYEVSDMGRVKRLKGKGRPKDRIRKLSLSGVNRKQTYYTVNLSFNGKCKTKYIHMLVAESFLGHKPDGIRSDSLIVDHIDGNSLNNTKENLQLVTTRQNIAKAERGEVTSNYTGVSWNEVASKWQSRIFVNGRSKSLGFYKDEFTAHAAYQKELLKLGSIIVVDSIAKLLKN